MGTTPNTMPPSPRPAYGLSKLTAQLCTSPDGRAGVQAVAAPVVVGLPGGSGCHKRDASGRRGGAHEERNVALPSIAGAELEEVRARAPRRRINVHTVVPTGSHGVSA